MRNSESWALESGIQLKESGIPLMINMQNLIVPLAKTRVNFLESGDHGRESRIQDSLGFSYTGRMDGSLGKNWIRKWRENSVKLLFFVKNTSFPRIIKQ